MFKQNHITHTHTHIQEATVRSPGSSRVGNVALHWWVLSQHRTHLPCPSSLALVRPNPHICAQPRRHTLIHTHTQINLSHTLISTHLQGTIYSPSTHPHLHHSLLPLCHLVLQEASLVLCPTICFHSDILLQCEFCVSSFDVSYSFTKSTWFYVSNVS